MKFKRIHRGETPGVFVNSRHCFELYSLDLSLENRINAFGLKRMNRIPRHPVACGICKRSFINWVQNASRHATSPHITITEPEKFPPLGARRIFQIKHLLRKLTLKHLNKDRSDSNVFEACPTRKCCAGTEKNRTVYTNETISLTTQNQTSRIACRMSNNVR
jgi:hypothetical protein